MKLIFSTICLALLASVSFGQVKENKHSNSFDQAGESLIPIARQAGFHNWGFVISNYGVPFWDFPNPSGEFPRGSNNYPVFWVSFQIGVLKDPNASSPPFRYATSEGLGFGFSDFGTGPILNSGVPFDSLQADNDGAINVVHLIDTCRCRDDWTNWVLGGGPVDSTGQPLLVSQEDSWTVYNDADTIWHVGNGANESPIPGIGVEVRQSTYEFAAASNAVIIRLRVDNHTNVTYDSAYLSILVDPDIGAAGNDQAGTDTIRNMIYAYSQFPESTGKQYSVGAKLLHVDFGAGPTAQLAASTALAVDIASTSIIDAQRYFLMQGRDLDGTVRLASEGLVETDGSTFVFPGDPVGPAGLTSDSFWPNGADVKTTFSVGPFQLQPGIEYDLIFAIIGGEDPHLLGAITDLRNEADQLQTLFDNQIGYLLGISPTFSGPVAEFSTRATEGLPGEVIQFYDWSLANPHDTTTTWKWDFDNDGSFDYQDNESGNPLWSYATPGVYSVKLVVTDAAGSDSLVKDSLITVYATIATPFLDEFDSAPDPNPAVWINTTTRISDKADEPPSSPFALAIDGHPDGPESITSYPFDLIGLEDSAFVLCYSYQPQGNAGGGGQPEPEDSLIVEFRNDLNQWIKVQSFPGEGKFPFKTDTVYIDSVEGMMGTFFHDLFQFRFRGTAEQSGAELKDVWFVDDVYLGKLDPNHPTDIATGLGSGLPRVFKLHQNYPNPFNPTTTIKYDLPKDSKVTIRIFNVLGQEVRTLVDELQAAGFRSVVWNGKNHAENPVSSGVYVYRIEAGDFVQARKMMLLR